MVFNSIEEIERYLLEKCEKGLYEAQERIFNKIEEFIDKFYSEYDPELYQRTHQFYRSLVESKIIPTSNGYEAYVYFDIDQLDHSIKRLKTSNGGYRTIKNKGWSEETILETAMIGNFPHGGYSSAGGTGIWTNAIPEITEEAYQYLKQALISEGIPLK